MKQSSQECHQEALLSLWYSRLVNEHTCTSAVFASVKFVCLLLHLNLNPWQIGIAVLWRCKSVSEWKPTSREAYAHSQSNTRFLVVINSYCNLLLITSLVKQGPGLCVLPCHPIIGTTGSFLNPLNHGMKVLTWEIYVNIHVHVCSVCTNVILLKY